MVIGSAFVVIGAGLLLTVKPSSSVVYLAFACFVIGIGLGFSASPGVVAAQSSVDWTSRGVVTGANMFARSVGSAVGVAIFGAVANAVVASRLGNSHDDLGKLPGEILAPAIHDVYYGAAAAAVLLVVAVMFMPNRVAEMPRA
jgi:MFS family permease